MKSLQICNFLVAIAGKLAGILETKQIMPGENRVKVFVQFLRHSYKRDKMNEMIYNVNGNSQIITLLEEQF